MINPDVQARRSLVRERHVELARESRRPMRGGSGSPSDETRRIGTFFRLRVLTARAARASAPRPGLE